MILSYSAAYHRSWEGLQLLYGEGYHQNILNNNLLLFFSRTLATLRYSWTYYFLFHFYCRATNNFNEQSLSVSIRILRDIIDIIDSTMINKIAHSAQMCQKYRRALNTVLKSESGFQPCGAYTCDIPTLRDLYLQCCNPKGAYTCGFLTLRDYPIHNMT